MTPSTPRSDFDTARRLPLARTVLATASALAIASTLAACGGSDHDDNGERFGTPGNAVALTTLGRIVSFDLTTPGTLLSNHTIGGLAGGERLLGIDMRPADGLLYAVSNQGRILTIDPATGAATLKATLIAAAGDPYTALAGIDFGVDFNPVADRLRVVSDTGQNLRINVDSGAVISDGTINGAPAVITASAYTNSFVGTGTTQLYGIDVANATVYLQNPPNAGTLAMPLPLGVAGATAANGFDIDSRNNTGYAALTVGGTAQLHSFKIGAAAPAVVVGTIGNGEPLAGLALMQADVPKATALTALDQLVSFDPATPNNLSVPVAVSGLAAGETVLGIDFRPANGQLYALTSNARILTVVPETGVATPLSTLAADPADTSLPYSGLPAGVYSVDFNPVADRLRVISDAGLNLRINVDTGATTTDGVINRTVPASVVAAAYTNSYPAPTTTRLFDLDASRDVLAQQLPPNDGTLVDIGPLGLDLTGQNAIDIVGGDNGLVLAALRPGATGPYSLYAVSLTTGAATPYRNTSGNPALSVIGGASGPSVRDLAIRF